MAIADIRTTTIYEEALRSLGASNVERRRLGWRFWWGNPFASTTLLSASKPPAEKLPERSLLDRILSCRQAKRAGYSDRHKQPGPRSS